MFTRICLLGQIESEGLKPVRDMFSCSNWDIKNVHMTFKFNNVVQYPNGLSTHILYNYRHRGKHSQRSPNDYMIVML